MGSSRREGTLPRRGVPALLCNPALRRRPRTRTDWARVPRGTGKGSSPRLHSARGAALPSRPARLLGGGQPETQRHFRRFSKEAWAPPRHPLQPSRFPRCDIPSAGAWQPLGTGSREQDTHRVTRRRRTPATEEGGLPPETLLPQCLRKHLARYVKHQMTPKRVFGGEPRQQHGIQETLAEETGRCHLPGRRWTREWLLH